MRTLSMFLCAALLGMAASQQFNRFNPSRGFRGQQRRPQQNFQQRPQQNFQRQPQQPQQQAGGLYYSWEDIGRNAKFTWGQANAACKRRGQRLVSLDTPAKNQQIVSKIANDNIKYIWTGGQRSGSSTFRWQSGANVEPFNWSRTGGSGKQQPDNREGDENCLAILNRFYPGDGVTWHDVSCHHKKPFVCE